MASTYPVTYAVSAGNRQFKKVAPATAASPSMFAVLYKAPTLFSHSTNLVEVLGGSLLDNFVLRQPLLVTSEREADGLHIISDDVFAVYGDGDTYEEALYDYKQSLVEYYEMIEENLSVNEANQPVLAKLNQYIERKSLH